MPNSCAANWDCLRSVCKGENIVNANERWKSGEMESALNSITMRESAAAMNTDTATADESDSDAEVTYDADGSFVGSLCLPKPWFQAMVHRVAHELLGSAHSALPWVSRRGVEALQAATEDLLIKALAMAASSSANVEIRASHLACALQNIIAIPAPTSQSLSHHQAYRPVVFEPCLEELQRVINQLHHMGRGEDASTVTMMQESLLKISTCGMTATVAGAEAEGADQEDLEIIMQFPTEESWESLPRLWGIDPQLYYEISGYCGDDGKPHDAIKLQHFVSSVLPVLTEQIFSITNIRPAEFVFDQVQFSRCIAEVGQDFKTDLRWEPAAMVMLQSLVECEFRRLLRCRNDNVDDVRAKQRMHNEMAEHRRAYGTNASSAASRHRLVLRGWQFSDDDIRQAASNLGVALSSDGLLLAFLGEQLRIFCAHIVRHTVRFTEHARMRVVLAHHVFSAKTCVDKPSFYRAPVDDILTVASSIGDGSFTWIKFLRSLGLDHLASELLFADVSQLPAERVAAYVQGSSFDRSLLAGGLNGLLSGFNAAQNKEPTPLAGKGDMGKDWHELRLAEEELRKLFVSDCSRAISQTLICANVVTQIAAKKEEIKSATDAGDYDELIRLTEEIKALDVFRIEVQQKGSEGGTFLMSVDGSQEKTKCDANVAVLLPYAPIEGPASFCFGKTMASPLAWVDPAGFNTRWEEIAGETLRGLDWNHVFAAGGSVLSCLVDARTRKHFSNGDIDLFIHGLDPIAATAKLIQILNLVAANTGCTDIVVTPHSVTILGLVPNPPIQVVLRCYSCPAEILAGFDIDCCCVGFDGRSAYLTPRSSHSLRTNLNVIDLSRRSTTYESRLLKYAARGFGIAVPGLSQDEAGKLTDVNGSRLMSKASRDLHGLPMLLAAHLQTTQEKNLEGAHSIHAEEPLNRDDYQRELAEQKAINVRLAIKMQATENPERLAAAVNDYGYMPAFNVLTPDIIQLFYDRGLTTFQLADGRQTYLCKATELPNMNWNGSQRTLAHKGC